MKHCITVIQLNELSKRALKRLKKWHYENCQDELYSMSEVEYEFPILSISEMIQFIADHRHFYKEITNENDSHQGLCDNLWNDVKEILNDRT